ncbi:hypothetical protein GCM10023334_023920 [Nonomuraea thailandensis]
MEGGWLVARMLVRIVGARDSDRIHCAVPGPRGPRFRPTPTPGDCALFRTTGTAPPTGTIRLHAGARPRPRGQRFLLVRRPLAPTGRDQRAPTLRDVPRTHNR